ncbi:hypothetical protein LJR225_000853 [Phenylobacterium sp. LjRoot225]|uniref:hypothetical protein n=1 Tax=Phenylobacterium sp. LjRoot225 TaxID=3342285 RepID=UPI003ECD3A7F
MTAPARILLQTTITPVNDDWSIARFSLLAQLLRDLKDENGDPVFAVTARDRATTEGSDPVLSHLDESDFDALWLFAVDTGDGLNAEECAAISRFRRNGRGLMVTRDHMDLGSSVCTLGGVGAAHFFHSRNPDPDESRRVIDDTETSYILWPNYHSGANGDPQEIEPVGALHPVLSDPDSPGGRLRFLPAHPHEGAVGAPPDDASARVIAVGRSKATGATFNIAVAFERSEAGGRAIAQSTFHHFADYNWNPAMGAPSFVSEPPGHGLAASPEALRHVRQYAANVALWTAGILLPAERIAQDVALDEALAESFPASDPPAVA